MEISNLTEDIEGVYPSNWKKINKTDLNKLIKSRNNKRLSRLDEKEIPRIFFEPLFLQEPEILKKYITGEEEEEELFYNKEYIPSSSDYSLEDWEEEAGRFQFAKNDYDDDDPDDDDPDDDNPDDDDPDDDDPDDESVEKIMNHVDKHFSNFFSPSVYLLYKKLIRYLFLLRDHEFTFENCIPVFIRSASIRNTTSTIIYFGIYTKQSFEDNPTMTHYDFLYFENGKKTFHRYQDNIVSFLKQDKRNGHEPLSRINPILLNNPQLFFHNDGILEIEKTNVNKEFMRIKEDGLDFWLTYLFIDNQHDLVGGERISDSLPKYTKGVKNWKKYFSHISIFHAISGYFKCTVQY